MMNRMYHQFAGKSLLVLLWVIGLAGLLLIALWWSGTSTALAQDGGDGEPEHSGASPERDTDDHDGGSGGRLGLAYPTPRLCNASFKF